MKWQHWKRVRGSLPIPLFSVDVQCPLMNESCRCQEVCFLDLNVFYLNEEYFIITGRRYRFLIISSITVIKVFLIILQVINL